MTEKCASFINVLDGSPVIAAVKSEDGLTRALSSECAVIMLLNGSILNISSRLQTIKDAGRLALVHADLIEGLTVRDIAVDFIASTTLADGIVSTRPNLIRRAKELNLLAIQRFFLIDSISFDSVLKQSSHADIIDILPGTMPKIIERLTKLVRQPITASGLLTEKKDIVLALDAGAVAVSTTSENLWFV